MSRPKVTELLFYHKIIYYCPYPECAVEWEFASLAPLKEIEATLEEHLDTCHAGWTLADIARLVSGSTER